MEKIKRSFYQQNLVAIGQITPMAIRVLFKETAAMEKLVLKKKPAISLRGRTVAELFYQPSTRTFTSFLAAAKWLGAMTIPLHGMATYSSAVKGESIEDTVRTVHQTTGADLLVIRHPEDDSAERAAQASWVPVINAGSGKKEHPTQALLDLYTIKKELGRTIKLKVGFVGDLKYGRTIKSLGKLLVLLDSKLELFLVSSPSLRMPRSLIGEWRQQGARIQETTSLKKVIPLLDVLYMTRVQKEWFKSHQEYQKVKGACVLTPKLMERAKKKMIVMHPLPRVDEIDPEVDKDRRAVYFRQMRSGLYIRMALLKLILLKQQR